MKQNNYAHNTSTITVPKKPVARPLFMMSSEISSETSANYTSVLELLVSSQYDLVSRKYVQVLRTYEKEKMVLIP